MSDNGCRSLARASAAERQRGRALAARGPGERFLESYRAARLAASALLAPVPPRRGPVDVWARLAVEHPDLRQWAHSFAGFSRLAADLEVDLPRRVSVRLADDFLFAVDRFLDLVDRRVGVLGSAA